MTTTHAYKPLSKRFDLVIQELPQEILVYDLQKNKAFALNELSGLVWQLCDGNRTVIEIGENLTFRLNHLVSQDLVWLTLEQLKKVDLIEDSADFLSPLAGLTRREAMKRVGFSSMVGLPFIWSVVAPTSAHAASVCPAAACRCPNGSSICPGSTVSGLFVNCNTTTGNTDCDCMGPFGTVDSAGAGFKTGICSL
jgi:hypothetical protein